MGKVFMEEPSAIEALLADQMRARGRRLGGCMAHGSSSVFEEAGAGHAEPADRRPDVVVGHLILVHFTTVVVGSTGIEQLLGRDRAII